VNGIAGNESEIVRYGMIGFDSNGTVSSLWLHSDHKLEGSLGEVALDLPVEVIDVMIGPLNLESRSSV